MMGRLLCVEQSETSRRPEDSRPCPAEQGQYHLSSQYLGTASTIPHSRSHSDISFPPLAPADPRTHTPHRPAASILADIPPLEERAHSTFPESSFCAASLAEVKEVRSSAVSPSLKLPPIPPSKPSSAPNTTMPPHNTPEMLGQLPEMENDHSKSSGPSLMDMRMAYENMMVSYFMPQSLKSESTSLPDNRHREQFVPQQIQPCSTGYIQHPFPMPQATQNCQPFDNFAVPQTIPEAHCRKQSQRSVPTNKALAQKQNPHNFQRKQNSLPMAVGQHTSMDITSSGCTILDGRIMSEYQQPMNPVSAPQPNHMLKPEGAFHSCSLTNAPPIEANLIQTSSNETPSSVMAGGDQTPNIADMASVLSDLSMFMPSQDNTMGNAIFSDNNVQTSFVPTTTTRTTTTSVSSSANFQYQSKIDPTWGRFSVLPPVMSSATPLGSCMNDGDNISLMSYSSVPSNAQNNSQMGMYYTSFSPFSVNFPDNISSAFASSPRYSGRSSYSGRGSRNKRALSNSPLSADGIDLNSIIRMSPTSLMAYINGSRSSSSCVSPGSAGDRTGCYGHLSARNSSSSPHSGSGSSGNRRSTSYTPQTNTPNIANGRINNQSNVARDHSNVSEACGVNDNSKTDFLDIDENMLVIQAMQDLEAGAAGSAAFAFPPNIVQSSQVMSECENLQVLPQDIAAFRTEDLIPFIPAILPPVHSHLQPQFSSTPSQPLHSKPPPTYDQHMARKATLQKNSSSDSSQPSNSSSFESSEGDKTVGGSSGTDNEANRMYACRWLDCTAVFQDQDEFVTHIEKAHIDQRKGEDFVCYWKLCPRRLHPFNARYKLLVHMRVHSGDKPNKCTYAGCKKAFSRLENLKIHLRSHTGERPYSCTYPGCTKTFSNSSDRTKHQKTHHDTKPYVCQVVGCGKRYTDPSSLRKHVKKSHPDKKEPERKKIRGGVEELDPKDLNECLMIQAIKPITLCDASPPELTDSGLGRSPRGSQPGSSSDHYPGLVFASEAHSRSETAQGSSTHTSPSSHHSSPPGQNDREKLPANNNSLRVPILPPIAPSPVQQQSPSFSNQNLNSKMRPSSKTVVRQRAVSATSEAGATRSSSSLCQGTRTAQDMASSRIPSIYSPCSTNANYKTSPEMSISSILKSQSRFEEGGS